MYTSTHFAATKEKVKKVLLVPFTFQNHEMETILQDQPETQPYQRKIMVATIYIIINLIVILFKQHIQRNKNIGVVYEHVFLE